MPDAPTIRIATPDDIDAMARLHHRSHVESFAPFVPASWVQTRDLSDYKERWASTLARMDARNRAWVAEQGSEVVGIVQIREGRDGRAELSSMHVSPDRIATGVGRLLMETALSFLRQAGYSEAHLGVVAANHRARRFYERFGWSEFSASETGTEGVPIVRYRLNLAPHP